MYRSGWRRKARPTPYSHMNPQRRAILDTTDAVVGELAKLQTSMRRWRAGGVTPDEKRAMDTRMESARASVAMSKVVRHGPEKRADRLSDAISYLAIIAAGLEIYAESGNHKLADKARGFIVAINLAIRQLEQVMRMIENDH